MANGDPIWPGGRQKHEYEDVPAFLRDMLSVEGWHPDVEVWFQKTLDEIERLREERDSCETAWNRFCSAVNDIARVMGHVDKQCYAPEAVVRWVEQQVEEVERLREELKGSVKLRFTGEEKPRVWPRDDYHT